jgi:hypothetical protein
MSRKISNYVAVERIQRLLDGEEWSVDTLEAVAEIVRETGREVDDSGLLADWRYEVANGDTRRGFAEWVEAHAAATAQD